MMPPTGSAPAFAVPMREIVALEHPMIVKNIDNGLKTLGSGVPLQQVSICLQCGEGLSRSLCFLTHSGFLLACTTLC
jgi:hypothetical protein